MKKGLIFCIISAFVLNACNNFLRERVPLNEDRLFYFGVPGQKNGQGVVVSNGTFKMEGGTRPGYYSNNYGGGVYVEGTFTMVGGPIFGNDGTGTCNNNAGTGTTDFSGGGWDFTR